MKRMGVVGGRLMFQLSTGENIEAGIGEPYASQIVSDFLDTARPGTRLAMAVAALEACVAADTDYRAGQPAVHGGAAAIAKATLAAIAAIPDEAGLTRWSLVQTICRAENSGLACSCHHDKTIRPAAPCLRRERTAMAILTTIESPHS